MRTHSRYIIAHHLIFTGYGFWLPNCLRGSGSDEIRHDPLEQLGPVLPGRQPIQPSREELKKFYREANPLLKFEPLWFDSAKRQALAEVFARVIRDFAYTVYACAICSNHAHLLVRRYRDDAQTIWDTFAGASRDALRKSDGVVPDHPIWSDRPYKVFLYTPDDIRDRIDYANRNPLREGLSQQDWEFVRVYDGWPHGKR
jgi:REP element-mobilizing transposase RayT